MNIAKIIASRIGLEEFHKVSLSWRQPAEYELQALKIHCFYDYSGRDVEVKIVFLLNEKGDLFYSKVVVSQKEVKNIVVRGRISKHFEDTYNLRGFNE